MADNRIEITLKKRHTEYQEIAQSHSYSTISERRVATLLAAIADRLTDIADELGEKKDERK